MENRLNAKDCLKIVWMGIKVAIVLYAIFQASNLTILYQGF